MLLLLLHPTPRPYYQLHPTPRPRLNTLPLGVAGIMMPCGHLTVGNRKQCAAVLHVAMLNNCCAATQKENTERKNCALSLQMVYGLWSMVGGRWSVVYGLCGLWSMVYGLWSMVYGLWSVVCGLWSMVYGRCNCFQVLLERATQLLSRLVCLRCKHARTFHHPRIGVYLNRSPKSTLKQLCFTRIQI